MEKNGRKKSEMEAFDSSRQHFEELVKKLGSNETLRLDHGDLERFLQHQGFELLRLLMQDHFTLRAGREQKVVVNNHEGVHLSHHRKTESRQLETMFGTVELCRRGYYKPEVGAAHPLDRELNLPLDKYSHGLEERVAEESAKGSFDNVVEAIKKNTGGKVPKRQAEQLAVKAAHDFKAFYDTRRAKEAEDDESLLVMSLDGKGIVMRTEDLREATRLKAEKNPERKKRLGAGEKRNRKRMATVAAVYSVDEHRRSAEQIMGVEKYNTIRPRVRNKRVWAEVVAEPEEVTNALFAEALRRDPGQRRRWVMLVDGDPRQLDRIEAAKKRFGVDVTVVLDFIHVLEYLWDAAHAFHEPGSKEAQDWVRERALRVLHGKSSDVAAGMRRSATLQGMRGSKREAVDKCAGYLLKNREYLRYDLYLDVGFPIGTGVIEGACRHLVKDRMDLTGARWRLVGAEAVLRLRAMRASGDFQEYLRFHREQERIRNYTSKFTTRPVPLSEAA
jgi:hypothetical protein